MAGKRKVPQRICISCRARRPKRELIRLVRTPQGQICLDLKGKVSGRGAYICRQKSCLEQAIRGKRWEKHLGYPLSEEIIAEITALLQSDNERTS
ncbi:MAG TPA: YlxR family protein [Firmicutes bacterium]|jgi:predicted RNA-binding protein YlxR (DUF448 family)|nr:YlxR family protein [Bacillota bacterium]